MRTKVIVLVIILAVGAGIVVWASHRQKTLQNNVVNHQAKNSPTAPPMKVVKTEVDANKLPNQFPADIPVENGNKVTQNYNAAAESGLYQATRTFESAKSLDENFRLYMDFINKNGWKLLTSLNQPALKVIAAKKDNANLQITMSVNAQSKKNMVEISYTQQK